MFGSLVGAGSPSISPLAAANTVLLLQLSAAFIAGLASHLLYFIRGEHHLTGPRLLRLYLLAALVLFGFHLWLNSYRVRGAVAESAMVLGAYVVPLFASIFVYRVFLHRLRKFPGPFWAGVSKFWQVSKVLDSRNHLLLHGLHERYGDFVRTGPNEITVFVPEVLPAVNSRDNPCTKTAWYDFLLPEVAMNTTRDKEQHDQRRRVWDHGFSFKALAGYEARMVDIAHQLERVIASTAGKPVDASTWFYFFSFDVMGDLAFARSFRMLHDRQWHNAIVILRGGLALLGPLSPVPWLARILFSIPGVPAVRDWKQMRTWSMNLMTERIAMEGDKKDISSWLIGASAEKGTLAEDTYWLHGDSLAMVVAGSDTVALTLVYTFYHLALSPTHTELIRSELATLSSVYDLKGLQNLNHLNGVLNETLRLYPPVPTGGFRDTPPEGIDVAGTHIPGGVTIVAPRFTIGRLESAFPRANDFIPERWYSQPELVQDRRAFAPFSQGRYGCVGKNLAMSELRFVVALLVSKYNISFAPGEDGKRVWRDTLDQFTSVPGKLELVFEPREKVVEGG